MALKLLRKLSIFTLFLGLSLSIGCSSQSTISNNAHISENSNKRYLESIFRKVDVKSDLVYSEPFNSKGKPEKQLLDIFTPANDTEINRPAIIWVHGGGFVSGNKDSGIERDFAIEFAKKGYVTANINYRLREKPGDDWRGTFTDATTDLAYAVNWLVDNAEKYGVDKDRIAIAGYSAGGATLINLCYNNNPKINWKSDSIFATVNIAGGELWMGMPDKSSAPALIIHGTQDDIVPISTSHNLMNKLKNSQVKYTFNPLQGCSHDIRPQYEVVVDATSKFLYKELEGMD